MSTTNYELIRTSKKPNAPIRVLVDQPDPDSDAAGFAVGGSFNMAPGDRVPVSEAAAAAIMGDPSLAEHFKTEPAWTPRRAKHAEAAGAAAAEPTQGDKTAAKGTK